MCEEGVTPLFGTLHSAQWESSPCEACWPTWRATASPLTCGAAKHVDHLRVWSDFNASFHRLKIRFSYCTTVRSAILFNPNDPNTALRCTIMCSASGDRYEIANKNALKDSCYGAVVVSPWTRELRITCSPDNTSIRDIQKVKWVCKTSPIPSSLPCRVNLGLLEGFTISSILYLPLG